MNGHAPRSPNVLAYRTGPDLLPGRRDRAVSHSLKMISGGYALDRRPRFHFHPLIVAPFRVISNSVEDAIEDRSLAVAALSEMPSRAREQAGSPSQPRLCLKRRAARVSKRSRLQRAQERDEVCDLLAGKAQVELGVVVADDVAKGRETPVVVEAALLV